MILTLGLDAWSSLALSVGVQTMGNLTVYADPWDWHKEPDREQLQQELLDSLSPWQVIDAYYLPLLPAEGRFPALFDLSIGVPQRDTLRDPRCYALRPCAAVNVWCVPCGRYFPLVLDSQNRSLQDAADALRCPACTAYIWPWRRCASISLADCSGQCDRSNIEPPNVLPFSPVHHRKDSLNVQKRPT